jgi:hypothetical protein
MPGCSHVSNTKVIATFNEKFLVADVFREIHEDIPKGISCAACVGQFGADSYEIDFASSSSSSFCPLKSQNWALLVGIRQDTLCMLVTVCFHNLVTYAQRLQDLYSACLMFWMRTHTGPRFIVSSEGRESHQPQVSGVSYELENSCPWRAANPEPFALESDALPLRHWLFHHHHNCLCHHHTFFLSSSLELVTSWTLSGVDSSWAFC